jgi:hypothetical protein
MTAELAGTQTSSAAPGAPAEAVAESRPRREHVVSLLTWRWLFLTLLTLVAFHQTLFSVADAIRAGSLNGFLALMPIATVIAGVGVARRERVELPIHDRQTDIIVGLLGLTAAVMVQSVLLPRYALYFHLLRIDVAAMWFFVFSSSVILFGLRPVVRFGWVWVMLMLGFPLGYQLSVIVFGGNRPSAGLASLVIAAVATAISVGRTRNRAMMGAAAAVTLGLVLLVALAVLAPNAPLLVFQIVPASASMALVGMSMFFYARRGMPKRVLGRKLEPVAARQVLAGVPLVLAAAVAIVLVPLPDPAARVTPVPGMVFGRPLASPAGWHQVEQSNYPWVRRVYGRDADLIRQRFVADTGNPKWDKFSRPRTVVVDSTSTWLPFALKTYPVTVLYDDSHSRISDPIEVDLGHGVTGSLVTVVDDARLLTYNLMSWIWGDEDAAQRILIAAVDNHEDEVVFPEPSGGLSTTVRAMVTVFFRGNQATWDSDPNYKDADLLTEFGRGLVAAQLRGITP